MQRLCDSSATVLMPLDFGSTFCASVRLGRAGSEALDAALFRVADVPILRMYTGLGMRFSYEPWIAEQIGDVFHRLCTNCECYDVHHSNCEKMR